VPFITDADGKIQIVRVGRPPRELGVFRVPLGIRVRDDLRERLVLAAAEQGRSLTDVVEEALLRAFPST